MPGVLTPPKLISGPKPRFTRELKRKRLNCDVSVSGVVTATGVIIDLQANRDADADAAISALEAVRAYRLTPATLDGKPVAMSIKVVVHFDIY